MSTLNLSSGSEKTEWKHLVGNYEDFQNELNNASEGIEFLKQLWTDFHLFEVIVSKFITSSVILRKFCRIFPNEKICMPRGS